MTWRQRLFKKASRFLTKKISLFNSICQFLFISILLGLFQLIYFYDVSDPIKYVPVIKDNEHITSVVCSPFQSVIIPKTSLNALFEINTVNSFDSIESYRKHLLNTKPYFDYLKISYVGPDFLSIEYTLKKVIAKAGNLENFLITYDGHVVPNRGIFSPNNLPSLFIPLKTNPTGINQLDRRYFNLCLSLISSMEANLETTYSILSINMLPCALSNPSNQEIIIHLEEYLEKVQEHEPIAKPWDIFIRLNSHHPIKNLDQFYSIHESIRKDLLNKTFKDTEVKPLIVDLRIPELATLQ